MPSIRRENVRHATFLFSAAGGRATKSREKRKQKETTMYCTKCGNQIDDSAAFCTRCGTPTNGEQRTTNKVVPSASSSGNQGRPKIPGITLAACIILYVIFGLGILSNLSRAGTIPGALLASSVGFGLLSIACVVYVQQGRNWARIVITAFWSLMTLLSFGSMPLLGVVLGIILATPFTFLWLPRSNNWYRAIKSQKK